LEKSRAVKILIVQHNGDLAGIWAAFLGRQGMDCVLAGTESESRTALRRQPFDAVILDMELPQALAVADFATYRTPEMPIIAVTADSFFSDGTIFELIPNARGLLRAPLRLEDMAALVEHYGGRYAEARRAVSSGG
jgi:DNA-binding NtrC family response regulator